ncbi:hypothetical protein, partial [Enterococcus sp. HPCN18]|uniref:hypothetical protein n=1 Tax=Enterococcus sp. HPCN18 TaxID=2248751 RepID=UPI000DCE11A6
TIQNPDVAANSFELKPVIIQIEQINQFRGTPNEDPNLHLASFPELCATFKYDGVSSDAVRHKLFPFSLRDKAKAWLNSLAPGSIR